MTSNTPGVLFDIDGTLVDSNYLHVVAWSRALREGGETVPMTTIHRLIGMGSSLLVERLVGEVRRELKDGHGRQFERLRDELRAFPEARELLEDVAAQGARVVLATSSREEDVGALLDAIGETDAVFTLTHGGDVDEAKPDPDVLMTAMEKGGLHPEHSILVGDTVWDVEAAGRAGIPCVCVLTGGISRAELEDAGAVAVYDDVADLRKHLADSPLARLLGG